MGISRWQYCSDCWKHSKKHWLVAAMIFVSAIYSFLGQLPAIVSFPPRLLVLAAQLPKLPLAWAAVISLIALLFVAIEGGYRLRIKENEKSRREISLEIRPSPGEVLNSFVELAHGETHYRMEIHNSGPEVARNVQVKLVKIEPRPISEYFRARADFPYFVRLAHLADGNVDSSTDHDINPGTSEYFELLFFWESADHRIIVNGIDTKQEFRNARFSIEENECWHLEYEVSSAQNGIQRPIFLVRRDGENLIMSRLV